jgi:hypothetical protein
VSVQERREQLLAWMRLRPPYKRGTIFRLSPLYTHIRTLDKDLRALSGEGRIYRTTSRRWSLVREAMV